MHFVKGLTNYIENMIITPRMCGGGKQNFDMVVVWLFFIFYLVIYTLLNPKH